METVAIEHFVPDYLQPCSKKWLNLVLWEGEEGPLSVPVALFRGKTPGPITLAVAGVHGDEFEGMEALRGLVSELVPHQFDGTFIAIPVINPFAYEGQTRETPSYLDGLNLARQFPGKKAGTVTERLADIWATFVTRLLGPDDTFIDFHSAGTRYEYVSMVAFHETGDATEAQSHVLAKVFDLCRIWRIPDRPDTRVTFNGFIARQGIPTIATEIRGRGGCLPQDVVKLQHGLRRILTWKNNLSDEMSPIDPSTFQELVWSTEWVLVHSTGFFRPYVDLCETVVSGQLLGAIVSLTGQIIEEVHAPVNGRVWAIRRFSTVQAGDYVFLLAFGIV